MASALNGGIAAPRGRRRPLAAARPKSGVGPLPINPQGRGMLNPPGGGLPTPASAARGRGRKPQAIGGKGKAPGMGLAGAAMTGPGGRQLQARVQSGAITGQQAQKTMQQRQTLAKALGPNWRDKLSVGGKSFAQVNKGLAANPDNSKLAALRKRLVANRSTLLEQAREKGKKKKPPVGSAETLGE